MERSRCLSVTNAEADEGWTEERFEGGFMVKEGDSFCFGENGLLALFVGSSVVMMKVKRRMWVWFVGVLSDERRSFRVVSW